MANKKETLKLDDSVKQNTKGQVILGKLRGPCADFINPTRNNRKYNEELWQKVFDSDVINEYFEAGGIPGELDHPVDRLETSSEKIAIMMPEKPFKDSEGHLIAEFDILDTPNGRIAYTLAKYGYKLGISSRGNGDVIAESNGTERVDEDTYDFQAFDLVLLPAVKSARLNMVESLQKDTGFKKAITEALNKAKPDEKKVMTETLDKLNIEYTPEEVIDKESDIVAENNRTTMINDLQEAIVVNHKQETQIIELQEKLSVCYAKEAKYEEDVLKYKNAIRTLSESAGNAKALQNKLNSLNEQLKEKDLLLQRERDSYKRILEKHELGVNRQNNLTESISEKNSIIEKEKLKAKSLRESLQKLENNSLKEKQLLEENLAEVKKNLSIKTTEYTNKLASTNKLVEQYRETAKTAVNRYIESKACMLGISINEIKNKLPSNYSFNDIDLICENLSQYNLKVGKLPFELQRDTRVVVKESQEPIKPKSRFDDTVDESLMRLADLN